MFDRATQLRRAPFTAMVILTTTVVQAALADEIQFNRDVRPILSNNCFKCHGPDSAAREADLRLDRREDAIDYGAIVPGDVDSEVLARIYSEDEDLRMPPPASHKELKQSEKELLRRWIAEGAAYEAHWAFIPVPQDVPVPAVEYPQAVIVNPIDAFVAARLQATEYESAPAAARETWLRRVSFDLTGLPPTLAELDEFLVDDSPDAFETAVDRLLDSQTYGEHMASDWLDVARYADTFGYQADREMHVWPWRDWVIEAFNENLPYDKFIMWQIAGDLLPEPTDEQRLATAFNRLHRQTNEGGSVPEEFRVAYVADRVNTIGTAFLGLSLECASCHDHKYDPIAQQEYYELSAFVNNIDEHGMYSHFTETAATPAMLLYKPGEKAEHQRLQAAVSDAEATLNQVRQEAQSNFATWRENFEGTIDAPSPISQYSFDDAEGNGANESIEGVEGKAIRFTGDDQYVCKDAGVFGRTTPFSVGVWVNPHEHRPRTVVLHRSRAAEDSAFRGYSLVLDDGKPTFSLIHFWPGNAIRVQAAESLPLDAWTHVTVTYDGSSHAAGLQIYINCIAVEQEVIRDKLTRDITHRSEWGDAAVNEVQLTLGARFRDVGFKDGGVDELQLFDHKLTPPEVAAVAGIEAGVDEAGLLEHYLARHDDGVQQARTKLREARTAENDFVSKVRQIMVMDELPQRRPTYVLQRGAYDARDAEVQPATPRGIFAFPDEFPNNRLGLAMWMVDQRNPLTSRVAVNRLWQRFLGHGIVATPEDFGGQGQPPSHPQLLDWLARHFMDSGWDTKALCRLIVLSATYRQSSLPSDPRLYEEDPQNRLLARGPRHRLRGEQIRDNALAVSGLLVPTIGGPSVKPYQPAGLWAESGTGKTYVPDEGDGLYRRSMYTFWRRTAPPPSMMAFDATSREVCTARRERTTTPLQALALLNDPQMIEASRMLAERLIHEHPEDVEARLPIAFRLLTSRTPTEKETEILRQMYDEQREHYVTATEDAVALLNTGASPRDENLPAEDHAAMTVVVEALMNFDESMTKH